MNFREIILTFSLFISLRAYSERLVPYVLVDKSYNKTIGKPIEVSNMPRFRSTDSLPICQGVAPATVLQHQYCRTNKLDCSKITPDQEFSSLHLAGLSIGENNNITFGGSSMTVIYKIANQAFFHP